MAGLGHGGLGRRRVALHASRRADSVDHGPATASRLSRALAGPRRSPCVARVEVVQFLLATRMLLARTHLHGARRREELLARAAAFRQKKWGQLLAAARRLNPLRKQGADVAAEAMAAERKREQACAKVRKGELSRACHLLTAAELAPDNLAVVGRPRSPPSATTHGSAVRRSDCHCSGLAGCEERMRAERLKILLQDQPALELLAYATTRLANAQVPTKKQKNFFPGLVLACLTALGKPDGGVRGIATGDMLCP